MGGTGNRRDQMRRLSGGFNFEFDGAFVPPDKGENYSQSIYNGNCH